MEQVKDVPSYIRKMYENNNFMVNFGVEIGEIQNGSAEVSLNLDPAKHFNHNGVCHGGALLALADSVLGVTGASVGCRVATLSYNMNFIRNVNTATRVTVRGRIVHSGRTTMVIQSEMRDEKGTLMAEIATTMFVMGHYEEIPAKW